MVTYSHLTSHCDSDRHLSSATGQLTSLAVILEWAYYDCLTGRCKLVAGVARTLFPVLRHTRYTGCKLKTDFYLMN